MIQELFLYFARFPKKSGVTAMFTMGDSDYDEYQQLLTMLDTMQDCERVPEIDNYVYGQSIEDLRQRINRLHGSWMMVDYGEITVTDVKTPGSMEVQQQVAVTIAIKMRQNADMAERVIASERTLDMMRRTFALLYADSDSGRLDWLARGELGKAEIVPFVASELSSYGWTLMFQTAMPASSPDGFLSGKNWKPAKEKLW